MTHQKKIIFILPYLNVNTTSSERFKSFIKAAEKNEKLIVEVIEIDYGIKTSYFSGLTMSEIDYFHPKNHRLIKPNFNSLQKLAFYSLNNGYLKTWRLLQFLHLIFFGEDVFTLGRINSKSLTNDSIKEGFILTSGSHFSLFSAASLIAKELNYKLILDYRDPWTFGYNPIDGFKFIHWLKVLIGRSKEKALLEVADVISTVSTSLKYFFPKKFQHKIQVVPNGSNFLNTEVSDFNHPSLFKIVYAGTIYNEQLKEEDFFVAVQKFMADKEISKIKLEFLGAAGSFKLKELLDKYDLLKATLITSRLSRNDLLRHLNDASVFLHLRYQNNKVISSKQAEYLNFCRPILLPISDQGDLAESIIKNNAGYVCNDIQSIVNALEELWAKFNKGENFYIKQDETFLKSISREAIADDFVKKISELF